MNEDRRDVADDDVETALVRRPAAPPPLAVLVRASTGSYHLSEGRCVVGSGAGCELLLRDPSVSRQHVELTLAPEGVRVRDLGSTNGTFYLGQRVEQMVLALGSRISVGADTLSLDADPAALSDGALYPYDEYRGIVGHSASMRRLFVLLQRLEGSLATVLVEGESGVGKEMIAHALHNGSTVAAGPFVPVNCGALPREIVPSELFGHKRGAFSGAVESRRGAFESADGGTLFLDEVGELPLEVQPMLLRALETGEIRPVGEDQSRRTRVRVVAATNRDLAQEVQGGRFREDLFYRLAVVRLHVPPLHERREDIEPLALRFAQAFRVAELPRHVLEDLKSRTYPGNVRELKNLIQSYAALDILPEGLGSMPRGNLERELRGAIDLERPYLEQRDGLVDLFTTLYLDALLERAGGNQTAAARMAGLDRTYLGRLLARYKRR
jgi:transcriptional regulator with GAF, ATPase, and Fis domain